MFVQLSVWISFDEDDDTAINSSVFEHVVFRDFVSKQPNALKISLMATNHEPFQTLQPCAALFIQQIHQFGLPRVDFDKMVSNRAV